MSLTRRAMLAASAALLVPPAARAASITDAAGRAIAIPETVARVFPAGPPAAIMLYTLAPDLLLGWPRANRAEECAFMLPDVCARPEVGRLTGRGNTANLESVLVLKPDLILDVGSTSPTFASLAAHVQEQTGIPYALLDGRWAPRQVIIDQVMRELKVAALASDFGADQHPRPVRIPKARHLAIPVDQREISVVNQRLEAFLAQLVHHHLERGAHLGEDQNLGRWFLPPNFLKGPEKSQKLRISNRELDPAVRKRLIERGRGRLQPAYETGQGGPSQVRASTHPLQRLGACRKLFEGDFKPVSMQASLGKASHDHSSVADQGV